MQFPTLELMLLFTHILHQHRSDGTTWCQHQTPAMRATPQQWSVQNCSASLWWVVTTSRLGPGNCSTCLAGRNAVFCFRALAFDYQLLTYWHRMDNFLIIARKSNSQVRSFQLLHGPPSTPDALMLKYCIGRAFLNDTTWTGNTFDS